MLGLTGAGLDGRPMSDPVPAAAPRPLVLGTGIAACGAIYVANAWPNLWTVVDDAFITARYSAHLAEGFGPVYNAHEPAIEGYTSPAWMLLLAAGEVLDLPAVDVMVLSGLFFGVVALVLSAGLAAALAGRWSWEALMAPAALASSVHFAVASTSGLETSAWVAGVLGALWVGLTARGGWRLAAGLAAGSLAAVRPEGAAVAVLLVAWDLLDRRARLSEPASWWLAVGVALAGVSMLAIRLATYGDIVPNTLHAKAAHTVTFLMNHNGSYLGRDAWVWPAAGALWLLGPVLRPRHAPTWLAFAVAAVLVAAALQVELWMPGGRLMLASLALAQCAAAAWVAVHPSRWRWLLVAGLAAAAVLQTPTGRTRFARSWDRQHSVLPHNGTRAAAAHLRRHVPEGSWMVTRDAGVFPYYVGTGIRVAETHQRALTRPHPDGAATDLATTVPERPDIVVSTVARLEAKQARYGSDRRVLHGLKEPFVYLGRVEQHYHRYYDVYARAALEVPPFPDAIVVGRQGPPPPVRPPR